MRLAGILAVFFILRSLSAEISVTRRHPVDTFFMKGSCKGGSCLGHSMGTAMALSGDGCSCACFPHLPAYREDLHICVDDLHDCPLIPFISGTTYQKIPYVFLPLKGQIIYPSAELVFAGAQSPICVVSGARYLSPTGWEELRNRTDAEPPFRLFPDEGRTFLQWLGDSDLRFEMEGRLILVHLMCKDMVDEQNPDNNIFTSCVSFRVAGTPSEINPRNGVKEVAFSVDTQTQGQNMGSSYIVIAISSVLLGLIYVVSVFLYLQGKKNNKKYNENPNAPLTVAEEGVVKNNPLLKHCHDNAGYTSDSVNSASDSEEVSDILNTTEESRIRNIQTSVLIHPCTSEKENKKPSLSSPQQESSSFERLPEENVSIVETLDYREERSDALAAISCTYGRRKLYFNPAYFEPELLLAPPPAAIEFLTKIREVISIAKAKMDAKKFLPSLMGIPEEFDYSMHKGSSIGTESTVVLRRVQNNRCKSENFEKSKSLRSLESCQSCRNNEHKLTSIERWLENVPHMRDEDTSTRDNPLINPKLCANSCNINDAQNTNKIYENSIICDRNHKVNYKPHTPINCDGVDTSKDLNGKKCGKSEIIANTHHSEEVTNLNKLTENSEIDSFLCDKESLTAYVNVDSNETMSSHSNEHKTNILKSNQECYVFVRNKNIWGEDCVNKNTNIATNKGMKYELSEYASSDSEIKNEINSALTSTNDNHNKKITNSKLNGTKDDHDYETIMLNQANGDTQSLPDFINRPNGYSLVSEVYVNDGYDYISESSQSNLSSLNSNISEEQTINEKIMQAHLTIKVQDDPPINYCNDSDSFEPDTLDRKPNKLKINQEMNLNIEINQDIYADSLERPQHISLKSSGTFRNETAWNNIGMQNRNLKQPLNRAFGSLREIFEAKTKYNQCTHNKSIKSCSPVGSTRSLTNETETYSTSSWRRGNSKLLRAEARLAKRQRQPSPPNHITPKPPIELGSTEPVVTSQQGGPPLPPRIVKPPLPPKNGLIRSNNQELASDNLNNLSNFSKSLVAHDNIIRFMDIASESSEYEPLCSLESCNIDYHNSVFKSNSKTKIVNDVNHSNEKKQSNRIQNRTEDSGYLSSDSNGSESIVIKEDSISETDDSFFDGASESGAESIATDSFFFGKYNKYSKTSADESCHSPNHFDEFCTTDVQDNISLGNNSF